MDFNRLPRFLSSIKKALRKILKVLEVSKISSLSKHPAPVIYDSQKIECGMMDTKRHIGDVAEEA